MESAFNFRTNEPWNLFCILIKGGKGSSKTFLQGTLKTLDYAPGSMGVLWHTVPIYSLAIIKTSQESDKFHFK